MRKALYILSQIEDTDIEWLAQKGTVDRLSTNSVLIQEGRSISQLYIVLEGALSVRVGGLGGEQIAKLLSGEIVGEISFVDTRPPGASVVALEDSVVLSIDRAILLRKLDADGLFAARFYRAIASFLADRLYVTVGRFGYGSHRQDTQADPDEMDDDTMEHVSVASARFDQLLKLLRSDYRTRSTSTAAGSTT